MPKSPLPQGERIKERGHAVLDTTVLAPVPATG